MISRLLAAIVILLCSLSPAAANQHVTLQLPWDHQFQFAGYYAADLMGFYAAAGLEVKIKSSITAQKQFLEPTDEVLAGRADFGIGSGDIILANEAGNQLRVIASIFQSSATRFYRKQAQPFISLAELVETSTIARRVNSFVDIEFQAMLRSEGIDPETVKAFPTIPGVAHFVDGRVDVIGGYTLTFPYEIKKHQIATTEISPQNYGVNFYGDSVFTSQKLIDENPELVEKFLTATLKGWRYALENPAPLVDYISEQLPRSHPIDNARRFNSFQAEHINQHTNYPLVEPGHINPYRWKTMHEALRDAGLVSSTFEPAQLIWSPALAKQQQSEQLRKIGAILLALSLSAALILLIFIFLLKKLVKEKTASLLAANQESLQRQAEFEAVFHSITDAIILTDQQRQIIRVNKAFTLQFGYQQDEVQGQLTERIYAEPKRYNDQAQRGDNPNVHNGSQAYVMQYRCQDNSVFSGETLGGAVTTAAGEPLGFLTVIRDISARLESEEQIRQLSRFPDENPGPVIRADAAGIIIYANLASATLLAAWETGVGTPLPDPLIEVLAHAREQQQSLLTQIDLGTQSYSFVITPVAGEDYVNFYGQDITESKNLENQLRQSEKMQAIGQLAGGIAHDFNNQLGVILGSAELLSQNLTEQRQKKYLLSIKSAASRAADLTKKLLAFSRKGKYVSRPIAVHKVIAEVIALLEHSIDKRISIRQSLSATQDIIIGDPVLLQNAFLNLALNARDAMPEGGKISFISNLVYIGSIECSRFSEPITPGQYLLISISDTGCGMDDESQRHMFEPFFTTKDEGRGTGLGLASVYGTVRNHSAAIQVNSTPGQGTEINLYFPLTTTLQPDEESPLAIEPISGSGHILVVDDEAAFREMIAEMLMQLGYSVTTCKDGQAAIERYQNAGKSYDLVILDMIMPGLNGRETFLAMQQINPEIRAILASGFGHDGDIQQLLDLGLSGFIGKPFNQRELSEKVAQLLNA